MEYYRRFWPQVDIKIPEGLAQMIDWTLIIRSDVLLPRLSSPSCSGSPVLAGALQHCALQDPRAFAEDVLKPLLEGSGEFSVEQERLIMHVLQCSDLVTAEVCVELVEATCQVSTFCILTLAVGRNMQPLRVL